MLRWRKNELRKTTIWTWNNMGRSPNYDRNSNIFHITDGLNSLHRKWHTRNRYMVESAENRIRSNLELLPVKNVKKWLKIAVCSSPLSIYHGTGNIIKQSFISYSSMKLRHWVLVLLFALSFKKVWIRPRSTLKKIIDPYSWVNIVFEKILDFVPS